MKSYKPGIALISWAVLFLVLAIQNKMLIHEIAGDDLQYVILSFIVVFFGLFFSGMMCIAIAAKDSQHEFDTNHYAKINESHLCQDCAKYMNNNQYKITRI